MSQKSLTPIYLPKPMREGEDQETHEIGITQNEENMNQNFNYLYNRLLNLETLVASKEENQNG